MRLKLLFIALIWSTGLFAISFSPEEKANGQQMSKEHGTVTLIFATGSDYYALSKDSILEVYVSGSINDMQDMVDGYRLDEWSEDSCFYHTFSCEELKQPGNSGQPEFVFYVLKHDSSTANFYGCHLQKVQMDSRLLFYNGIPYTLILMPGGADYFTTDLDELEARGTYARVIRPLQDFNLTDSVDQHRISNFRLTPGTTNLYRSYHPYYPSNPKQDTELARLYWVGELAQAAQIGSDISLTGDLSYTVGQKIFFQGDSVEITIPQYYQTLMDNNQVLYVGEKIGFHPSVAMCYYHSQDTLLSLWLKEIVEWIINESHPMPMLMHCAIGADRTGMVCAIIAALCGADWNSISADYSETSNMQIQTYRHPNRLRYGLQLMCGLDPAKCTSKELAAAIRTHLVDRMNVVTNQQIDAMVHRLKTSSSSLSLIDMDTFPNRSVDILGRPIEMMTNQVIIQKGRKYLYWHL